MADWVTISSLATAGGTLTLAMTTYLSVRSANQAARTAERTLLAELRPLVIQSSLDDADQRIGFMDNVGLTVPGGTTGVEIIERRIYLVFSLRNVGPGIAVLHGGLYGDYEGGQRVITRFGVARDDDGVWRHSAVRHWQIDRSDPR